jgi:hypothetical protein
MKNTPSFIVYAGYLDDMEMTDEDVSVVASVVTRLSKHGSEDVAEALSDGSIEQTAEFLHAGFEMVMASKTYAAAGVTNPLQSHYSLDDEYLSIPSVEVAYNNDPSYVVVTEKCHRCGAICQGEVTEDGCNVCCDEEGEVYNECDCQVSGGFEDHTLCLLHQHELPDRMNVDGCPKPFSWRGTYDMVPTPGSKFIWEEKP